MSHRPTVFLIIFVGGGIGSILRHAANQVSAAIFGVNFPSGTLLVNIVGSFCMGLLAGWFAFRGRSNHALQRFLATGVLGGFTTFSAFSLEAALLWERGQVGIATLYVVTSVVVAIIGVFVGLGVTRAFLA